MQDPGTSLHVSVEGAVRAGSLWRPSGPARSIILMIPGSGRSTRTCNDYFLPIIDRLLASGHAVAAFDKRGAGMSTGSFRETEIALQVDDALKCLDVVCGELDQVPVGVFGHSQGGWVAYELAARRPSLAFIISNSGPAVGPAAQERSLLLQNPNPEQAVAEVQVYDQAVAAARQGAPTGDVVSQLLTIDSLRARLDDQPEAEPVEWDLEVSFMRHEPGAALRSLHVHTLVIHGELDEMIPVHESFDELTSIANPMIETAMLRGANHRLLDTAGGDLVEGYLPVVTGFVDRVLR